MHSLVRFLAVRTNKEEMLIKAQTKWFWPYYMTVRTWYRFAHPAIGNRPHKLA